MKPLSIPLMLLSISLCTAADEIPNSASLRMNQIQTVATHNSYHLAPSEPLFTQVKAAYPAAASWDYAHPPLDEQLDNGVRGFELDLYYDPEAIRVFHVPTFDMNSSCETFVDCLTVLHTWSKAHPKHVPVIVLLELKGDHVAQAQVKVLPFDAPAMDQVEEELLSVFGAEDLIRPDDVRGDEPTLKGAVMEKGWPKLDAARGRVMFVLHTKGSPSELYAKDHPSLRGRSMFLETHGDPEHAAVYVRNNPEDPEIPKLVKAGFIVRTRADSGMKEAVAGNTARRDQAFASGAQVVTTDFPAGGAHEKTGYVVEIEDGKAARVNPVR